MVTLSFKFRIYPNKPELRLLNQTLELCRIGYNHLLEHKKKCFEQNQKCSYFDLNKFLKALKQDYSELNGVYSQVLQNLSKRIILGYDQYYDRLKKYSLNNNTHKPGLPRFKSYGRYRSFTYPQHKIPCKDKNGDTRYSYCFYVFQKENDIRNYLHLPKIGDVKINLHRSIPDNAEIKGLHIVKSNTDKWYAIFIIELDDITIFNSKNGKIRFGEDLIYPKFTVDENELSSRTVGGDLGLEHYLVLSDGNVIDNPRFFRKEDRERRKTQHKLSLIKEQCKPYWKDKLPLPSKLKTELYLKNKANARVNERIAFRRDNFTHKVSTSLVKKYDKIFLEDLSIKKMLKNNEVDKNNPQKKGLHKSIADAAWNQMVLKLQYKAESAGVEVQLVNPNLTSQQCHICGTINQKSLDDREHCCNNELCSIYNVPINRDLNAAFNIKNKALNNKNTNKNMGIGATMPEPSPGLTQDLV